MKIGILSKYYGSSNYGGNLQAYALCKALEKKGQVAEQICYFASNYKNRTIFTNFIKIPNYILSICRHIFYLKTKNKEYEKIAIRKNAIAPFNCSIKHSKDIYSSKTINQSLFEYDTFITGSDQVWYPDVFCPAFSLSFVKNKAKFSYAASISSNVIPNHLKCKYLEELSGLNGISVREEKAQQLLTLIGIKDVSVVVDPVFLLSEYEWNNITTDRIIDEKYIFCYFLGSDIAVRKFSSEYADSQKLKIVTIPYLQNEYRKSDDGFGDYSLFDVSPNRFLSLIKYADIIITDSFHACAFSVIFKKQFIACERIGGETMNSRLIELVELIEEPKRYLSAKEHYKMDYIENLSEIDYSKQFVNLEKRISFSNDFLNTIVNV